MEELKPCPFCGKTDRIRWMSKETYQKAMEIGGPSGQRIMCERCDVMMYDFRRHKSYEKYVESAIDKWNNRASAWIPVTEDKPRECKPVLGWIRRKSWPDDGPPIRVEEHAIGHRVGFSWYFDGYSSDTMCIAWQPLPEPYREEEE